MSVNELPHSIGKYQIESVLGKGAMGVVYRAFDSKIERTVALKVLHSHLLDGEQGDDFEQRFIQEAKAAARCLHPNIVTVFDFGVHETTPFIVMEYVEGIELKEQLQGEKAFSFVAAIDIITQILEALAYAHDKGVVHRDIKPANIMLMGNGRVKVSDFGVARLDNSDLTSTGMMVGTPNYMSPEGLHGFVVDNRSDLYSVGVLLFELLTRERPYKGVDLDEAMMPLDQCETLSKACKGQVKSIIQRALQPKPEKRYQNAASFLNPLVNILSQTGTEQGTVIYQPTQVVRIAKSKPDLSDASIHPEVLSTLESSLIRYVGPTARMLVKKYSKQNMSLQDLSMSLANQIPNENERSEFLRSLDSSGIYEISLAKDAERRSGVTDSNSHANVSVHEDKGNETLILSPEKLQSVTRELAYFVGPLASRLVKKVFKQSSNIDDFYKKLASFIPDASEQDVFLKKVKL